MKQQNFILVVSLSLIFSSAPATGQNIYRWTDAQGRVHFSNAPVSEATAVDDELPPAPNFGGIQDSSSSSLETSPSADQPSDSPSSIATRSPDEGTTEDSAEPTINDDEAITDSEPTATTEEATVSEDEEPAMKDSDTEAFPQASVDSSEHGEPVMQTAADEEEAPSLLEEDPDQPPLDQ